MGRIRFELRYAWAWLTIRFPDNLAWWIALHLPRKIALLAFTRVTAAWPSGPGADYSPIYEHWTRPR